MNKPQQAPQQHNQSLEHGKTMLSTLIGAVIGCGAMLLFYDTLLGGAQQAKKIDQIQSTVEHNRLVVEESLALFKKFEANVHAPVPHDDGKLSKLPTQRELNDAINGLFEGLEEGAPAGGDSSAPKPDQTASSEQKQASAQSVDSSVKVVNPQNTVDQTESK